MARYVSISEVIDHGYDDDYGSPVTTHESYIIDLAKAKAIMSEAPGSFNYIDRLLDEIIEGKTSLITSFKYSFTDTDFERKLIEVSGVVADRHVEIEVNM